jgi:hypothetical protein
VTGVSGGTNVGSLLIYRDSENCDDVEGVSKVLCGLLFGVPGTFCLFPSRGTGIATGRYAISTCPSSSRSGCLVRCFLLHLSRSFAFQIPCLNALLYDLGVPQIPFLVDSQHDNLASIGEL